jgi:biopolymer transport protein ExbD
MSIRIHCTACNTQHSVHERLAGRSIRCPSCDAMIEVAQQATSPGQDSPDQDLADQDLVESIELVDEPEKVEAIELGDREISEVESNSGTDVDERAEAIQKFRRSLAATTGFQGSGGDGNGSIAQDEDEEEEVQEITFPKKELPKDDMDMTPMVDVTFLLLIFFMITASFSSEKVIEEPPSMSDKPSAQQKEEPEKVLDTVRVQVDEFNAYTIILPGGEDRQASSKQDLLMALDDARREIVTGANDDALKMAVEAHVDSIHAAVIAALDAGRDKGFSSFQVTVVEEFD